MASSVRSRPNHYEVLGLGPRASSEDIRRAFVGKMSVFGAHSMDETAQFLVAYETLRDPAKRRSYDASLAPPAKTAQGQWSFAVTPPRWSPFMVPARMNRAQHEPSSVERASEPHVSARPSPSAPVERSITSPGAPPAPKTDKPALPELSPRRPAEAPRQSRLNDDLDVVLEHIRTTGRGEREKLDRAQNKSPDWRKTALALGGLVLGAGIFGTLAGLSVKDNVSPAEAEPAPPRPHPVGREPKEVASSPAQGAAISEAALEPPVRLEAPASRTRRAASRQRAQWSRRMPDTPAAEDRAATDLGAESNGPQADADPQPTEAVAANLPLPSKLVAHTIERIGYPCGQVSTTTPVAGDAPGVYKITCSSGHTYQARPTHGRYRFRRLDGR